MGQANASAGRGWIAEVGGWSRDDWRWRPADGRWTEAHGLPERPLHFALSTDPAPARERYDFWRDIAYYGFDAAPLPAERARRFRARVEGVAHVEGEFYAYRSHGVAGERSARAAAGYDDHLCLGLVASGQRMSEQAGDRAMTARRGGLFAFDTRRHDRIAWSDHRASHLVLRHRAVERALGRGVPPASVLVAAIDSAPLAGAIRDQFAMMARRMGVLGESERAFLLHQTVQLVLFALQGVAGRRDDGGPAARAALHAAALRLIEAEFARPELGVDEIAARLGCGRATLYRAFTEREQGVAEAIREHRLERARLLLAATPERAVNEIALASGWYDTANFARAFRRRYGRSPSEWRAARAR